ncbi:hypothetical protein V3Q77_08370 [Flavobacterium davisii]|uniref:Uncharacterized protein n=1 Tax=Flavobacterium davisii TaxID=2906077 RepID=A0ABW8PPR0_9FLAO
MNFNCKEQLAGVAELDFILLTETANWPLVLTDQNSSQIVFTPESVSVEAVVKPDSIKVNVNKKVAPEGVVHQITMKLMFLTRSESLEQLLEQYEGLPGIVIAKLNNGFQKIYGTNDEPLYLLYEVEEGDKPDGESGTTLEIKGETRSRPVYYSV